MHMITDRRATRDTSMELISAWIHDDQASVMRIVKHADTPGLLADVGLVAAALVRCWAQQIGIQPELLMQDLAMLHATGDLPIE